MADGWLSKPFSLKGKRVWVAGHRGLAGAAVMRRLQSENCEVIAVPREKLDLRIQADVNAWIRLNKPDVIVLAAAKVGGILANSMQPADFLYDNLMIEANVIKAAHEAGVQKLLFLGSSCIYPRDAEQPMTEDMLLTGSFEPTNEAYAIAKVAGLRLCQAYRQQHGCDFIAAMPCNLYGPGDTFDERASHVIPALMMKAHKAASDGAKTLEVWGTGMPRREFLHADDLADALVFLLQNYSGEKPVNVGSGEEISILELAVRIATVTGFAGRLVFDESKPDGVMRKVMDSSRIFNAGWRPRTSLWAGLRQTYDWYKTAAAEKYAA